MKPRILLVNDDSREIIVFRQIFSEETSYVTSPLAVMPKNFGTSSSASTAISGFELLLAEDLENALRQVQGFIQDEVPVSIIFISINRHETQERIAFAKDIQLLDPRVYLVLFTDAKGEQFDTQLQALESSVLLLKKPFDVDEVKQLALHFAQEWHKDNSLATLQKGLEKKMAENIFEASMYSLLNPILLSISDKVNSQVGLLSFLQQQVQPVEESQSTFLEINERLQADSKSLSKTVQVVQQLFSESNEITVFTIESARSRIFNLIPELKNLPDDIEFTTDLTLDPSLSLSLPTNLMILAITSLVRNALESVNRHLLKAKKVTEKGHVHLHSEMVSETKVCLSIQDNGEGFEPARFDDIDAFILSGIATADEIRFQLVKVFLESVKGEFSIESKGPGKGVFVKLILPLSIHQIP
ncbi:MAG: hypothetical protein JXR47_08980 [Thiotrichales bacterium]|nr:hypothetical protein [Thiotrichales bacterium]